MTICPFTIATCRYEGCYFYSEKTELCVFQLIMKELENDEGNIKKLLNKDVKR